nr:MAG TPA: Protein of unknown function (DUF1018) [Caudoviricetes sp.]
MAPTSSYATFFALLKQMPGADKESLILQWTGGRTSSLREMDEREYNMMLRDLRSQVEDLTSKRKARSAVLKQMQLYGIDTTDWDAIDRFCCNPRIAGKRFSHLSVNELKVLRTKILSIRDKAERKEETLRRRRFLEVKTNGQLPS